MIGHLAAAVGCSRVVAEAAIDIHLIRAEPSFERKCASRTTLARKAVTDDDPHRIACRLKTELCAVTSSNSPSHDTPLVAVQAGVKRSGVIGELNVILVGWRRPIAVADSAGGG